MYNIYKIQDSEVLLLVILSTEYLKVNYFWRLCCPATLL